MRKTGSVTAWQNFVKVKDVQSSWAGKKVKLRSLVQLPTVEPYLTLSIGNTQASES